MKKLFTTLALATATIFAANAQRSINIQAILVTPEPGDTIVLNSPNSSDSIEIRCLFVNLGPDSFTAQDTIRYADNATGGVRSLYLTNASSVIRMGDTSNYTRKILPTSTTIDDGLGTFCASVALADNAGNSIPDPDTSNNRSCSDIYWLNYTSIEKTTKVENYSLAVYPNPTSTDINFKYNFTTNTNASVKVTDVTGRTVLVQDFGKQTVGERNFSINVATLNTGMYYVELVTDEARAISKFNVTK